MLGSTKVAPLTGCFDKDLLRASHNLNATEGALVVLAPSNYAGTYGPLMFRVARPHGPADYIGYDTARPRMAVTHTHMPSSHTIRMH